ncbi:MAG: SRPBCC family protein, partial [Pseudomonadota bacterium]
MPKFESTRRVGHSAEKMFALVADIEKYPEFVPLCESLRIKQRREREGKQMLVADMAV